MSVDKDNALTGVVIGSAISVHRELGPGLDEIAYETALSGSLTARGVRHDCQKPMPVVYKGSILDCGFRLDMVVEDRLLIELKAVESILPIHEAQVLTYMRLGKYSLGLLVNFEVDLLKDGIRRRVMSSPGRVRSAAPLQEGRDLDPFSAGLIGAAFEVHRTLGPGLLRSAYEECLCLELALRGISYKRGCKIPLEFEGRELDCFARIPLVVADQVPVFCLSVRRVTRLDEARVLARLRQANWPYGFLLNFNSDRLDRGIRRLTR